MISGEMAMRTRFLHMLIMALIMAAVAAADALAQNAASVPPTPPPAPASIADLQQQLRQAGFDPGPVNGVMTEKTRRAMAAYQRRTGHPPDILADPVRDAQTSLMRLGLFAGPADGVLGPQTRDAIIRFEIGQHLAIDPRISDALLAALAQAEAARAPAAASAPSAIPSAPAAPEARGRVSLPAWVNPPPIR
jgi:peptidoglycan hydrolase-like protein with peptidoglycan-binding domain